ncbi:MAG: hypothetical protein KGI49_02990 [Patescibacteria group bacterium]|nr:hypothetical protein [Patescibacteria group bacterium]
MKKSSPKTIATIVGLIIVAVVIYFYIEGGSAPASSSLLVSQAGEASVGSAELDLLNEIRSLNIDSSFFNDPAYQSLQDYSVPVPTENVGRPNPFAPIPGVATPGSQPSASPTGH